MGTLAVLGQFFMGIGVMLLGLAAVWWVAVCASRKD
jgi:hypothetical protein